VTSNYEKRERGKSEDKKRWKKIKGRQIPKSADHFPPTLLILVYAFESIANLSYNYLTNVN